MSTQRDEILNQLRSQGWEAANLENHALDWWSDEIWRLESVRSPVGRQAYLTFLVDPQINPAGRKKYEGVWAVGVTPVKPLSRVEAESKFVLSLGSGWKDELPKLLDYLSAMRAR
ncbi:MAG: hypothetical protein ACJ741_00520 [Pyrinomonadaceae bacterium]